MNLLILTLGEAGALHISAWWNRRHNVRVDGRGGERSILIGSALVLAGYAVWAGTQAAPLSGRRAALGLGLAYLGAYGGAKSAWLRFVAEDRADAALYGGAP